jgi:hypothetical protein
MCSRSWYRWNRRYLHQVIQEPSGGNAGGDSLQLVVQDGSGGGGGAGAVGGNASGSDSGNGGMEQVTDLIPTFSSTRTTSGFMQVEVEVDQIVQGEARNRWR